MADQGPSAQDAAPEAGSAADHQRRRRPTRGPAPKMSFKAEALEFDRNGIPIFHGEVELLEEYKKRARDINCTTGALGPSVSAARPSTYGEERAEPPTTQSRASRTPS